jgi:Ca-activated chloride channel family protein
VGEERQSATGADVLVVFDCSRSMLATDLYPNRLETARRKCLDLMRLAPETRLALMPFAAMPVLRCPLSGDRNALEEMLKDCHPDLFPADQGFQGTAIGTAVQEGLKVLDRQVERGQAILVLSDGADDDAEAVKAAAAAAKAAGVPVYGLFFGDPGKEVTLAIDGRDQVMKASRATLDELATATGALCVDARNDDQDITLVHDHLRKHVAQAPWEENRRIVQSERYQWLLLPGLVLIFLGAMMPTRRRRAV